VVEQALKTCFEKIFDFKKVTFDHMGESQEQNCLFVEVENSTNRVKDGKFVSKVTGIAKVFAPNDKLPIGYFNQKIAMALSVYTKDLFFYEVDSSAQTFGNIVMRSFRFVYFFNSQFNPATGTITDINLEELDS
jgi:hypothetical protein